MYVNQLKVISLFIVITSLLPLCIIYAKTNEGLGKKKEIRAFKGMLLSFIIYTLVDLRCLSDHFHTAFPRFFTSFVMSLGFVAMTTSCYFWFMYVYTGAHLNFRFKRRIHAIYTLPVVFIIVMLFTPLHVFAYEETDSGLVLKPMLLVVIVINYLYLLLATVISTYKAFHVKNRGELKKNISQIFYILFFTASGLAVNYVRNIPVIELCMLPVVLQNFVDLQDSRIYTDALTNLNNRSRMDEYYREEIAACGEAHPFTVIMLDLDFFKSINDILGHDEGDKILIAFSKAIKNSLRTRQALAARWGGDEFVIMGFEPGLERNLRDRLTKELKNNTELAFLPLFSIGVYHCTSPSVTLKQSLLHADQEMYKDKEIQHRRGQSFRRELKDLKHHARI